jgi:hypothetical protein
MLKQVVHVELLGYQSFNLCANMLLLNGSKEPGQGPHAPHLSDKLPHKHGGRQRDTVNLKYVHSSTRTASVV